MSFQVVRKKLTPNEITPPNVRYNPDCDCVQTSVDGGVTWTDNPGADPRTSPAFRGPPLTGGSAQCDAAANMVAALQQMVQADISADNLLALGTELLAIALLFVPGAGWVADVFLIIADGIILLDQATIEAAFTPTVYDDLLCTFFNNLDTDGQMSDTQLTDFLADVAANYDGTVSGVISNHSQSLGAVGWSNAGSLGHETGDCTTCGEHCFTIDFTLTDGSEFGIDAAGAFGDWTSGIGWVGRNTGGDFSDVTLIWNFPVELICTGIEMVFSKSGSGGADNVNRLNALNPVINYASTLIDTNTDNPDGIAISKGISLASIPLQGMATDINTGSDGSGDSIVLSFTVHYTSDIPTGWSDNC